jgi:hypothetical protein
METKSRIISLKAILIAIGIGIWILVLQNAGIIPTKQNVYVKGGYIDADVSGSVSVDNQVDVNLDAINGKSNVFYDFGGDKNYVRIPVMTTYPSGD